MPTPASALGIIGSAAGEAAAFAAGIAVGPTLVPAVRFLENEAWSTAPDKPLDPATAAAVAAENVDAYDAMAQQALYNGIAGALFKDLYGVTLEAPGTGELLNMLRRGTINDGNFTHGLRKAKLEPMWDAALEELKQVRLSPQELALGIVRSVVADPGLLATTLDLSGGVVPAYPEWPGDALTEALAGGIDKDRLRVMVGEIGLPMSAQQAASAYFRKIIALGDYNRAILEGDTRPEWAPYILDQARQILTAGEYAELQLRGFYDRATRLGNTAKHGMSAADSDLLYDVLGRGPAVHAVTTGLARGGTYDGNATTAPEPYLSALERSNVRPEWYSIEYANRYTYPSGFQIKSEATTGALTEAEAEELLLEVGWAPKWATFFATEWTGGSGAVSDPHVKKAQTTLFTEAHKQYVKGGIGVAAVTPAFDALTIPTAAQTEILALWDVERTIQADPAIE